jgi:hypothetical protein
LTNSIAARKVDLEVGFGLGVLEQGGAYNKSCQLQDVKCRIKFSNLEFKYRIEYTTHKATKLQEAMGGEGLYYVGGLTN